jgi:F0F1-type ATP synthase assembly protein I
MAIYLYIVGGIVGVASSLFVWWLTIKKIVPRIKFNEKILKTLTNENKSKYKYQFSIENEGCRNAIDLEVAVRARIKDDEKWKIIYLPTDTWESKKITILRPRLKIHSQTNIEIQAYKCKDLENEFFSEKISKKSEERTLEDIMSLGEVELEISILATDEFSGARKYFEKIYKKEDIVEHLKKDNQMEKNCCFYYIIAAIFVGIVVIGIGIGLLYDKIWEVILISIGTGLIVAGIILLKNSHKFKKNKNE